MGCCLRCIFCWVSPARDFPEKFGSFYSPEEAFGRLAKAARRYGVRKLRVSGAEPTLGKDHLIGLLECVEQSEFPLFILETNGIILGVDDDYVAKLAKFSKVHVRVSLKAGTAEGFAKRTGAVPHAFELPYRAIGRLLDCGASFHVAAMSDPRLMPREERLAMIQRLRDIDEGLPLRLEEETCDPYDTTILRMEAVGVDARAFFLENRPIH